MWLSLWGTRRLSIALSPWTYLRQRSTDETGDHLSRRLLIFSVRKFQWQLLTVIRSWCISKLEEFRNGRIHYQYHINSVPVTPVSSKPFMCGIVLKEALQTWPISYTEAWRSNKPGTLLSRSPYPPQILGEVPWKEKKYLNIFRIKFSEMDLRSM